MPPTRRTATRLVAARCLRGWSCRIEIAPSDADRLDDARISTVILVGPAEKVELAITSSPHTMGAQRFRRARLGQVGARCGTACGAVRQRARPRAKSSAVPGDVNATPVPPAIHLTIAAVEAALTAMPDAKTQATIARRLQRDRHCATVRRSRWTSRTGDRDARPAGRVGDDGPTAPPHRR